MTDYKFVRQGGGATTSQIFQIFITASNATTFAGLTGLAYSSGSLVAYYHKDTNTTATAITLVDMTVGTFTSSGFKEIDATNMPGWYQFCPPNACFSSGNSVVFSLQGAANMRQVTIEVDMTATPANLIQIDQVASASATLNLKQLNIVNTTGHAIIATGGSNGCGIIATADGTASGIKATGGATGHGALFTGGATSGDGLRATGGGNGIGIDALGTSNNNGLAAFGSGSGNGIGAQGGTTGNGMALVGGATSGSGLVANATTSGAGIVGLGVGSGNNGLLITGATDGNAAQFVGTGSGTGIVATGGLTGHGFAATGGATSGNGAVFTANGSGVGANFIGVGTVSILATQGISGPLDATVYTSIADATLKRDMSSVTGEASRSLLNCLRFIRNKWSTSGGTLTVTKEDDSTSAWTATVTTSPTADPIIQFVGN